MEPNPKIKKTLGKQLKTAKTESKKSIPDSYSSLIIEPKKKEKKEINPFDQLTASIKAKMTKLQASLEIKPDLSANMPLKDTLAYLRNKTNDLILKNTYLKHKNDCFEYIFNSIINLKEVSKHQIDSFLRTHVKNFYEIESVGKHEFASDNLVFQRESNFKDSNLDEVQS